MADADNVKSEVEVINICIKAQDASEVQFKIKKTTKMEKVFQAYATKKAMNRTDLKFVFEGNILSGEITAAVAGLEDGDVVDAMVTQLGGGAAAAAGAGAGAAGLRLRRCG